MYILISLIYRIICNHAHQPQQCPSPGSDQHPYAPEKEVWLVTFSPCRNNIPRGKFNKVLYHRCKKMNGHYSQTHRGWWSRAEEIGKEELRQNLLCEKTREKSEGQRGGQYSNRSAAQVLKRSVKKAENSKKVTLHTLRNSYATHLTNQGVNIQHLQEILGHNSPKRTMIYTHLSGKDIRKIRSPIDDMDI